MIPSFLLSLREGFEAALILDLVFSALYKVQRSELDSAVWRGAATAAGVSVLAAVLLHFLGAEFEGRAENIFEFKILTLSVRKNIRDFEINRNSSS